MRDWFRSSVRQWARARRLPARARRYLVEAAFSLLVARAALKVVPFRRLTWFFERPSRRPGPAGDERRRMCDGAEWLIDEAARLLPGETACFPRAIVAQAMLRRRGIGTTLYYGAARSPEGELKTHVWLKDGDLGIVGHAIAGQYRVLASYPDPAWEGKRFLSSI